MNVPEEFMRLAGGFHQDSRLNLLTEQEWIRSALLHLDGNQKRVVRQFLSKLLDGSHNEVELQRVWNSTSADYYVSGKNGLQGFLKQIMDAIEM